jgi:16S rRNA G966 N2-methylase RsmD
MNQLYYGENLQILREHIPDESVDLIYLDPPPSADVGSNFTLVNLLLTPRDSAGITVLG